MNYHKLTDCENEILLEFAEFDNGTGVRECHLMMHQMNPLRTFAEQLSGLVKSIENVRKERYPDFKMVFGRCFVSDAANQEQPVLACLRKSDGVISVIEQPPLNGTKLAMWAYLQTDVEIRALADNIAETRHNGYRHLWSSMVTAEECGAYGQTKRAFGDYIEGLSSTGYDFANDCMRTWLFVNDIDNKYPAVVNARNEVFDTWNLTRSTHFISSTGIYGRKAASGIAVQMDAYAMKGLSAKQVEHLYAPTHMNPTHEYGVRFERGTCIKFGDRREVLISGTASIDNNGEIVHKGDIRSQTHRMWENVGVLLAEADCSFADVGHMIVYLRDSSDYLVVRTLFNERFPEVPTVIVHAPVCRPGWLIEMECMATKADMNEQFRSF